VIISNTVVLQDNEYELNAIRSQGAGGQNVNKVSSEIHLSFDINASSLPSFYKERLLALKDKRLTKDGVIIIKAQIHRTQEKNKIDAINRLKELIQSVAVVQRVRRATKPTKNANRKRVETKKQRGSVKALRKKVDH
jgi:ribosome-associated protein